jgi:hypothetical protein
VLPEIVAPAVGEVMDMEMLPTVIATPAETVVPPGPTATAVRVWLPFANVVASNASPYGIVVAGAPTFAPSTFNCTLVIGPPTLTATATLDPATVAPEDGELIEIVGGADEAFSIATTLPFRRMYSFAGVAGVRPWPNDAFAPNNTNSQAPSKLWRTKFLRV